MPPERPHSHASTSGALAALGGFLAWGFFPLYWKQLEGINAAELIAHRIVWSLVFLGAVLLARRSGFGAVGKALKSRRLVGYSLLSGGLLTANWLTYVWAVTHDYVIESSLGYFLVPLFIVVLGALVLGERLRALQWLAVGFAAAGVALMLLGVGRLPWIALALAGSWSLYGLMRKRSALGALDGLMVETILYAPLAVACLAWREHTGNGAFGHADLRTRAHLERGLGYGPSAHPLRLRRAAHPAFDARTDAVPCPDRAVPDRAPALSRAIRHGALQGMPSHLARRRPLHGRQLLGATPVSSIGRRRLTDVA
jgi:chloramphenicol-sensitive protein RarD